MSRAPVLCIGSALWDIIAAASRPMRDGFDMAGKIHRQTGGVALNIAVALVRQGQPAALLSAIGNDAEGDALIAELEKIGVDCSYVYRSAEPTDAYLAIEHPGGDIFGAIADCASLEQVGDAVLAPLHDGRLASAKAPWQGAIVVDGNLPEAVMADLGNDPALRGAHLSFVPASPGKAQRLRTALSHSNATLYINRGEAEILCAQRFADSMAAVDPLFDLGAKRVVITDGPHANTFANGKVQVSLTPLSVTAVSTTGAGDVFTAAHLAAELASGHLGKTSQADAMAVLQAANDAATKHITRESP